LNISEDLVKKCLIPGWASWRWHDTDYLHGYNFRAFLAV